MIHCLAPVYGVDHPSDVLLERCYRAALELAEEKGLGSLAFPAVSTGAFGYPMDEAAEVAIGAVASALPELQRVRLVRFVLASRAALELHAAALERLERE